MLWLAALGLVMRSQGAAWPLAATAPLGGWLTAGILREASRDLTQGRGVAWGGRRYERLSPRIDDARARSDRAEAVG